ncbi:MAG: penicillin-binding protein [Saprospiraceae bacterium]
MDIKNELLWRIYTIMFLVVVFAMFIFGRAILIQTQETEELMAMADSLYVDYRPVMADRGNIIAEDGSLLATSLPYFKVYMDTKATGLTKDTFYTYVDTLARSLANMTNSKYTYGGYLDRLQLARENNNRYLLIAKNITFQDLELMKRFPLFKKGRYKGGFIVERMSKRQRPFRMLAHRTVGYVRENANPVGLEGAFDDVLKGEQGFQYMQRIPGNVWIPLSDVSAIEPENGHDIVTTIDVNIQDVAGNALLRALKKHDADHGCAVVMEVKTGAIRAIANIGKTKDGNFWENYNYAVGESTEPGSTFKLAAIMALLEDNLVTLNDTVSLEMGKTEFYEETMVDASFHQLDSATVRKAFEISSNVAIAKMVNENYNLTKKGDKFIARLQQMGLDKQTGIEIEGEGNAYIKEAYSSTWSGTTLPWMATGYEVQLTPLQMLNFYNAVANNGVMMQPYLVSKLQDYGKTYEEITPKVLNKKIASYETIKQVQSLLEGVVKRGTAKSINPPNYSIAGKTGTAQINYRKRKPGSKTQYQASFAGYFPADNPEYSCIVVINDPKINGFYGSEVAAPVFKEIADRCYASKIDLHLPSNPQGNEKIAFTSNKLPDFNIGYKDDFTNALSFFEIQHKDLAQSTPWTVVNADSTALKFQPRKGMERGIVPNVVGMKLRDAVYQLEKVGLKVKVTGVGTVRSQSVPAFASTSGKRVITISLK